MQLIRNGIYRTENDKLYVILIIENVFNQVLAISKIPSDLTTNEEINNYLKTYMEPTIPLEICSKKFFENCGFLGTINDEFANKCREKYFAKINGKSQF